MKQGSPKNVPFTQGITITIIIFSSVLFLETTTAIGLTNIPLQQQKAYAQEICEWWDPTCVGDFVGDDDAAVAPPSSPPEAPDTETATSTPPPSDEGLAPVTADEPEYCDSNIRTDCLPTDYIYDSNSGIIVCDGTQYDCSAYTNGFDITPTTDTEGDTTTPTPDDVSTDSVDCYEDTNGTIVCPTTIIGEKPSDDPCAPDHIPQPMPFSYDPDVNVISHYTENWNGQITKDWLTANCFSSTSNTYPQTWVHPSGKQIVLLRESSSNQPADSQPPPDEGSPADPIIEEVKGYAETCNNEINNLHEMSDQLKNIEPTSEDYATKYNALVNSFNTFSDQMHEVISPRVGELEGERDTIDPNLLPLFDESVNNVKSCLNWIDGGALAQLLEGLPSPP